MGKRTRIRRTFAILLILLCISIELSARMCSAQLSQSELSPISTSTMPIRSRAPTRPLKPTDKQTLEDIFRKVDLKTAEAPPLDLSHQFVPGLSESGVEQLGINRFVVVTGGPENSMSQIYAENRADGKSNFITSDSILHPYFAFANGLLGTVIEESLYGDLKSLLRSMISASIADYHKSEDDEVKDDIQRNLAFLGVAVKLLDPQAALPDMGGANQLVESDWQAVRKGTYGRSAIFGTKEDFSMYQPWGFMMKTEKLRRFHLAYQWLSRNAFPLSNVSKNTTEGGGNSFRRTVLLYRCLALTNRKGEPGLSTWNKIASIMALTSFDVSAKRNTIIPPELAPSLKTSPQDLDSVLESLSQPFLRTKLLLAVRKQKPVELKARSVFEMGDKGGTDGDDVVFRFFPLIDPPELDWLKEVAHNYTENVQGPNPLPLGLLPLHAHGAAEATNLLAAQTDSLDKSLCSKVPRLERLSRAVSADADQRVVDRHWALISCLFRQYPDSAQLAMRSQFWLARQVETAIAAWIDSYCAYKPLNEQPAGDDAATADGATSGKGTSHGIDKAGNESTRGGGTESKGTATANGDEKAAVPGTANGAEKAAGPGTASGATPGRAAQPQRPGMRISRKIRFQYLDPRLELYKQLQFDLQNLSYSLAALKVFPEKYKSRTQDFNRLFQRLEAIAAHECKGEPINPTDFELLSNIDRILTPVDNAIAANVFLDVAADAVSPQSPPNAKAADGKQSSPGAPIKAETKRSSATATATATATGASAPQAVRPANPNADAEGKSTDAVPGRGATIGLGKAARLFMICNTSQGPVLTTGAMYSYYEIGGGPVKPEHWERKLSYGTMIPPCWTRSFDLTIDKNNKASPVSGQSSKAAVHRFSSYGDD